MSGRESGCKRLEFSDINIGDSYIEEFKVSKEMGQEYRWKSM